MKTIFTAIQTSMLLAIISVSISGAQEKPFPTLKPAAAEKKHVLFVNVGGALSESAFADGVGKVLSLLPFNIWTNSIATSMTGVLLAQPALLQKEFGAQAAVVVFIERNAVGSSFVQAPGSWSMVNMRGLDKDNPPPEVLQERTRKMFLKGMAHAAGIGSNIDQHCAMWHGSFTLEGMDRTSSSLGPYAYFPMQEVLRVIGGKELLTPVR